MREGTDRCWTLYTATGTCALASHIALEDAGAEYRIVRLDFAGGDQRKPDYLAVNPKGRVPSLATERGVLTETPAILAYVAQRFPAAGLAPLADPFAFAEVRPSTAIFVLPCTWPMPTRRAAIAGPGMWRRRRH